MREKIAPALRWAGKFACLGGMAFFLLPVFRRGFSLGCLFGEFVCLAGLLLLSSSRLSRRGGWKRRAVCAAAAVYCAGLCWAVYLTALMFSAAWNVPPPGTNVVVLGAQVYDSRSMGISLTDRVETAFAYLEEHPQALCVVTGGQGGDEPCPEAHTQKNVLESMGVEGDRILVEDRSHNTRENFLFARQIALEHGMGDEIAVVTQGFHMFRALRLAEAAGFTPYSLVAETDPLLFPEFYGKELLSLTKWHVERLFIE